MLMRWQECREVDVFSFVDCRRLLITVFSDAHLQMALSPSLLDYLIDEVYLILQNIAQREKTDSPMFHAYSYSEECIQTKFYFVIRIFAKDQNRL